jgi:uncharacterized membrane protein YhhN
MFSVLFWLFAGVCALVYGVLLVKNRPSTSRTMFKTMAIGFLALLALIGDVYLLAIALGLSAVGDACLAQDEKWLRPGIAAFAAAHLAYVALFLISGGGAGLDAARLMAQILILVAAASFVLWLWPDLGPMRVLVGLYLGIITIMTMAAIGLPAGLALAGIGAVMFFASDGVLAAEMFKLKPNAPARAWTPYPVWALYWGGQAAITAAFVGRMG